MRSKTVIALLALVCVAEAGVIAWQIGKSSVTEGRRPAGKILTLSAPLPVQEPIDGATVFTIPAGLTIQESTPTGLATPLDRAGPEYVVVLRTSGGPRGPALSGESPWMDSYVIHDPRKAPPTSAPAHP